MPQTRKPASTSSPRGGKPAGPPFRKRAKPAIKAGADGTPSAETIRQALEDLNIDRPYMACRVVGNRLELTLYGGDVVFWPPKATRRRKTT